MPTLACWTCGRRIEVAEALQLLPPNARRCPRCGAPMHEERRDHERRQAPRRQHPPPDPGAPGGLERRQNDRRFRNDRGRQG